MLLQFDGGAFTPTETKKRSRNPWSTCITIGFQYIQFVVDTAHLIFRHDGLPHQLHQSACAKHFMHTFVCSRHGEVANGVVVPFRAMHFGALKLVINPGGPLTISQSRRDYSLVFFRVGSCITLSMAY